MDTIDDLARQIVFERSRADYAWQNTRLIDAARQAEMRKNDIAEAEIKKLRELLHQGLYQLSGGDATWLERVKDALGISTKMPA